MSDKALILAGEFEAASDEMWRGLVEKALGGRDFDRVMTSSTYDEIGIKGLYTQTDTAAAPRPALKNGEWGMVVPHWNPDVAATNAAIIEDLERGATGIALRLQAGRFPGIPAEKCVDALEGVYLNMASFTLIPGEEYAKGADTMLALLEGRSYGKADVQGSLGVDPLGTLAQTGRLIEGAEAALEKAAAIANRVKEGRWNIRTFTADSGPYHMAGATEAQELGLLIATGVSYLRVLVDAGMHLSDAARQISFSMAADADVSLTIAKFRAARLMWASVLAECGVSEAAPMALSAVSSLRMVSVKDPWVNILRSTAACFGAGVGGADTICVLPHDSMLGMSSAFARRIARNVQIILQEESGLSRVSDPAAGSYAFESITLDLSDKAWKYFQKIESNGGVLAGLRTGAIQADMQDAWNMRRMNIAKRKDAVTGVSEFPDIDEKPISNVGEMPSEPADIAEAGEEVAAVAFHRLAEDFEKLRYYSDACLEEAGKRPSVYLANIGTAADYTARSTFAKNFFEAGGIKAVVGVGGDATAVADGFKASGAKLVVLCSSDDKYAQRAEALVRSLSEAGGYVYLAGRPANADELKDAGVKDFIFMGCDVLEVLAQAHVVAGEKA
ncbi:MAG: methylmalonyl-CoA mutase small subunit [Alphaproteobacteria bacterium]|nr:methylmalonyl-CoA mutase small subunit [Alphaproteobacteria bacterium]